jgi:hypothetical protein
MGGAARIGAEDIIDDRVVNRSVGRHNNDVRGPG